MSRAETIALIRNGQRFLVTCHVRPDADALGSAMAFAVILRTLGKEAVVYSQDPPPRMLHFFPRLDEVARTMPAGPFDACFVMDAAAAPLVPKLPFKPVVMLDHHAAHDAFGDIIVRETDAAATAVIVLRLARELGVPAIPRDAAIPLYAALVADTGGFRYPGTTPETLRLAAELLEAGAEPWVAAYNLFEGWEHSRMRLLGSILESMSVEFGGKVAVLEVTRAMLDEVGADDEMVEGMVNYGRMLSGVEIAVLLWEQPTAETPITKISLRSSGNADVSKIAKKLDGGGHLSAAGANVPADIAETRRIVLGLVAEAIGDAPAERT